MNLVSMRSLIPDIFSIFRLFRRRSAETAFAVAALALGIGLSTAIFSILWGTVLRGLPLEDADRLVRVEYISEGEKLTPTDADFLAWRRNPISFTGVTAWSGSSFNLSGAGLEADHCNGAFVSANLFRLIGVHPLLGRDFDSRDERQSAPMVVILSSKLWKKRFNGDPNVLGKLIKLNGNPAQVIGVMPEGLEFPLRQELWVPLQLNPEPIPQIQMFRVQVLGKLKEGISRRQAEAELQANAAPHPEQGAENGIRVTPFVEAYTEDLQPVLYLLFGASIGLLLIVCANVSGLLTAQTVARLPEFAIRSAIGATRGQLFVQLMAETTVLSLVSAALSLPITAAAVRAYMASQGGELPSFWMDIRLDAPTIGYALAITGFAGLLSTIIPSLKVTGPQLNQILKSGMGKKAANPPGSFSGLRLVVQLALSFALLVSTGLILASLSRLGRLHFGYAPERVLTAQLLLPSAYSTPEERLRFFDELKSRLEEILGPGQAAFASALPGNAIDEAAVETEVQPRASEARASTVPYLIVSREYFRVLHILPLQGRLFNSSDRTQGQPVAIVNQSFVRRYFGTRQPVGARFRFLSSDGPGPWRSIVGVVPDLVLGKISDGHQEGVYVPLEQAPATWMAVLLRTPGPPAGFSRSLRRSVARVDREVPVFWIRTLQEKIEATHLPLKTMGQVFLTFGVAALFLSLLGIYGVTAQNVVSRYHEMAIRLTLGGRKRDLLRLISSQAFLPVPAGLLLGILLSYWTSRLVASVLFGVRAGEPTVFMVVGSVVLLGGLCACLLPSIKVLKVEPAEVLRGG